MYRYIYVSENKDTGQYEEIYLPELANNSLVMDGKLRLKYRTVNLGDQSDNAIRKRSIINDVLFVDESIRKTIKESSVYIKNISSEFIRIKIDHETV